ncbi:MAG: response regulator [Rubrivivax sp.]|nr:response regulator [Pyrinomonadaceae bacterium]
MGQNHTASKTVLIVDDYSDARELLKLFLSADGYNVAEASNGLEGVEAALLVHPDLIIMDISMPVLDGLDALRQIRRDDSLRDTPVLIITAHGKQGIDLYADNAELLNENTEYLPKPIDLGLLKDALNRLVPQD